VATEQQYLERDDVSQMLVLPVRPAICCLGILELYYHEAVPEVTNEFRRQCALCAGNAGNT